MESTMPSNCLILCLPLLLLPSVFPSIRVFSNESVLRIRWPKYWNFTFSLSPSSEYSGLISFRIDWLDYITILQFSLQNSSQIFICPSSCVCSSFYLHVHHLSSRPLWSFSVISWDWCFCLFYMYPLQALLTVELKCSLINRSHCYPAFSHSVWPIRKKSNIQPNFKSFWSCLLFSSKLITFYFTHKRATLSKVCLGFKKFFVLTEV